MDPWDRRKPVNTYLDARLRFLVRWSWAHVDRRGVKWTRVLDDEHKACFFFSLSLSLSLFFLVFFSVAFQGKKRNRASVQRQAAASGARSCDPVPERKRGRRLAASKINSKLKEPFQTELFRCSISGATLTINARKSRREERKTSTTDRTISFHSTSASRF